MRVDRIAKGRRKIMRAIREFQKLHGKVSIVTGTFGIQNDDAEGWKCEFPTRPRVCAMSALIMVYDDVDDRTNAISAAAKILGVPAYSVGRFIEGFDYGNEYASRSKWLQLGAEVRERVFGKEAQGV